MIRASRPAAFGLALTAFLGCAAAPLGSARARRPATVAENPACVSRMAERIRRGDPRVPAVLYHFGKRSVLSRLAAEGISAEEWAVRYRGPDPEWGVPPFRRGLYGCERAGRADPFGDREEPGFLRFRVRKECRQPARVATTRRIHEDPRFAAWIGDGLADYVGRCVKPDGSAIARLYHAFDAESRPVDDPVARCERILDRFLEDARIRVVHDEAVDASWYVRDLACVEKLEGSPAEVVGFLSERDFLADDECGAPDSSIFTFRAFTEALLAAPPPSAASLAAIRARWAAKGFRSPATSAWMAEFLDAYARCRARGGDLGPLAERAREFGREIGGIPLYSQYVYEAGAELDPGFSRVCAGE